MSFSQDVKQELAGHLPQSGKSRVAYLAAMFMQCGRRNAITEAVPSIRFQTENPTAARICFTLLKKTFNINVDVCVRTAHSAVYLLRLANAPAVAEALCIGGGYERLDLSDSDARKAFITGGFLCSGSVSDPDHSYHFEIVCSTEANAEFLKEQIASFGIACRIVLRKRHYVVYLKDGSRIVDMLGIMDAHVSLMNMENSRIVKDMRNSVNRRVNCETANISKTVSAAVKQVEAIRYLQERGKLQSLKPGLRQIAEVRLNNPDLPLKELGELLDPPVGKSGVNHRLRKLGELAEELKSRETPLLLE